MSKDWESHKKAMMKELAKLEKLGFSEEAKDQVFPYVIVETINILKNSVFVNNPVDFAKTGKDARKMMSDL